MTETIVARAGNFRNLVVSVTLLSLSAVVWSVVTSTPRPLAALVLLLPLCGVFVGRDARLVDRWRDGLLRVWADGALELGAFSGAIEAIPTLPPDTVRGMLETLPAADDPLEGRVTSATTRAATARVSSVIHAGHRRVLALRVTCYSIVAAGVAAALLTEAWHPLAGLLAFLPERCVRARIARRQLRRVEEIAVAARRDGDFQAERFLELSEPLYRSMVSAARNEELVASLRRACNANAG